MCTDMAGVGFQGVGGGGAAPRVPAPEGGAPEEGYLWGAAPVSLILIVSEGKCPWNEPALKIRLSENSAYRVNFRDFPSLEYPEDRAWM